MKFRIQSVLGARAVAGIFQVLFRAFLSLGEALKGDAELSSRTNYHHPAKSIHDQCREFVSKVERGGELRVDPTLT